MGLGKGSHRALFRRVSAARRRTESWWETKLTCRTDLPLPGGLCWWEVAFQGSVSGLQADHPSTWAKGHLLRGCELHHVVVLIALQ